VRWGAPAGTAKPYYFAKFTLNGGAPVNLKARNTIEFRIAPDCVLVQPNPDYGCSRPSLQQDAQNTAGSQTIQAILQDSSGRYSGYADIGSYIEQRQAVGINESPVNSQTIINPLYHAILSSARVPKTKFLQAMQNADFDIGAVQNLWIFMGTSTGGLFFGDVWASNAGGTSMQAPPRMARAALPLPPANAALRPATEQPFEDAVIVADAASMAPRNADPDSRIVAIRQTSVPAAAAGGPSRSEPMVEFTVSTPGPLVENSSGFMLLIGNDRVRAQRVASSISGSTTVTRLLVPAANVTAASDGAPVAVASGGSMWSFGALNKGAIR
jgi:hypothetical protein